MTAFPPLIRALLVTSLVLTIGRAITLPFITIYLMQHFRLAPDSVGLVLGISLTLSIIVSLYGGYLVDKFSKSSLILNATGLFSLTFFLLPLIGQTYWMVVVLALLYSAYSIISIAIKACFADWLPVTMRIKAFSANYTLINVGWALGPALGVLIASRSQQLPFILSGLLALLVLVTLAIRLRSYGTPPEAAGPEEDGGPAQVQSFAVTAAILRRDRRLIYFTLGSLFSAVVFGQFSGYLSQYLITVSDAEFTYRVIGSVMTVNAIIVISLQYLLSRNIRKENLIRWLALGTLFFIIGLCGFMLAYDSIPLWMLAMAIFTLGEIIVIPVEYLFIDFIAPAHLKGSYYGVQNLGNLGGAANPVMCGFILAYAAPGMMFYVLMLFALLGLGFFYRGYRLARQMEQQDCTAL